MQYEKLHAGAKEIVDDILPIGADEKTTSRAIGSIIGFACSTMIDAFSELKDSVKGVDQRVAVSAVREFDRNIHELAEKSNGKRS